MPRPTASPACGRRSSMTPTEHRRRSGLVHLRAGGARRRASRRPGRADRLGRRIDSGHVAFASIAGMRRRPCPADHGVLPRARASHVSPRGAPVRPAAAAAAGRDLPRARPVVGPARARRRSRWAGSPTSSTSATPRRSTTRTGSASWSADLARALSCRSATSRRCRAPAGCTISARSWSTGRSCRSPARWTTTSSPRSGSTPRSRPGCSGHSASRASEARSVEMHHERFDGRGYYRVPRRRHPAFRPLPDPGRFVGRHDVGPALPARHVCRRSRRPGRRGTRDAVPSGPRPRVSGRAGGRASGGRRSTPCSSWASVTASPPVAAEHRRRASRGLVGKRRRVLVRLLAAFSFALARSRDARSAPRTAARRGGPAAGYLQRRHVPPPPRHPQRAPDRDRRAGPGGNAVSRRLRSSIRTSA